jgi:hypothetical protein
MLKIIKSQIDTEYYPYARQIWICSLAKLNQFKFNMLELDKIPLKSPISETEAMTKNRAIQNEFNSCIAEMNEKVFLQILEFIQTSLNGNPVHQPEYKEDKIVEFSDKMNKKNGTLIQSFFDLTNYILKEHELTDECDESYVNAVVATKDQLYLLLENIISSKVFQDYKLDQYTYCKIMEKIASWDYKTHSAFKTDKSQQGYNVLLQHVYKLLQLAIEQIQGAYDQNKAAPYKIQEALITVDKNGHSFTKDLESYISDNVRPINSLLSGSLISFNFLLVLEAEIQRINPNESHTEINQALKSYYLDQ